MIIVKDNYLKTTLIKDLEFKKTTAQEDEEMKEEEKRIDGERPRQCPKCFKDYLPKDTKFGDCHYHDGFLVDVEKPDAPLTVNTARLIIQRAELIREQEEHATNKTPFPRLVWVCCGRRYGDSQMPCRVSSCGLPEKLKDKVNMQTDDYMVEVEKCFLENSETLEKHHQLRKNLEKLPTSSTATATSTTVRKSTRSFTTTGQN